MEKEGKLKKDELIALRFKEVRENYFHSEVMKDGKRSDHTQDDFAEYLGVTPQTIGNYESGRTPVKKDHLIKLSTDFGISLKYLLGEDDYRTEAERVEARNAKDWEEKILTPHEIDFLISSILEKMGYTGFEDDITENEFFTAEFEIPAGYTQHQHIPHEDIIGSFNNTYRRIRPQAYRGIKRESDGKTKYILERKLNAMFDDIESYIKYRIEREFR